MKTVLLVGLVATTALAQAPESLSGLIYHEKESLYGFSSSFDKVLSLRADHTYTAIIRETVYGAGHVNEGVTTIRGSDDGRYVYEKTGPNQGTLTIMSAKEFGTVTKNLVFESEHSGHSQFLLFATEFFLSSIDEAPVVNASTRGVASASKPLILGFYVSERPRYVLVRAVGPTLALYDVADAAEDTALEVVASNPPPSWPAGSSPWNDDWENDHLHILDEGATSLVTSVGAFMGAFPLPEGSKDAAIVLRFPPGAYTAIIRTKSETPAEVLGEIYIVP